MKASNRPPKGDGLGAIRFLVRGLTVLSFLIIVASVNYALTGSLQSLYNSPGEVMVGNTRSLEGRLKDDMDDVDMCTPYVLSVQVDKCAFVKKQCPKEGLIDYLQFYYCTAKGPTGWILFVLLLLIYFYLLGGTAERFFCPALCRLSAGLKMSPNVAGVTLLALGNGSPDIFSTIASVQQNLVGQAFGSLLGAGMFVTTVVVGSVTLAAKSVVPKVTRRPFLRDMGFYFVTIIAGFFICWDGSIRLWESILFIVWYLGYVGTVVVGRFIYQRQKKAKLLKLAMTKPANDMEEDDFEFIGNGGRSYDDYENDVLANAGPDRPSLLSAASSFEHVIMDPTLPPEVQVPASQRTKKSFGSKVAKKMAALGVYISKVGFWRNKTKNELRREARMTIAKYKYNVVEERQTVQRVSDLEDLDSNTSQSSSSNTSSSSHDQPAGSVKIRADGNWNIGSILNHQLLSPINEGEQSEDIDQDDTYFGSEYRGIDEGVKTFGGYGNGDEYEEEEEWTHEIDASTCTGAFRLNVRNFKDIIEWDDAKTIRSKVILFMDLPRLLIQHLTIHFSEPDTYFRPFYVIQPLGIAILLLSVLDGWTAQTALPGPLSAWIMPLAAILAFIIYFSTKNEEPPIYEWGFIVAGLLMSVIWIYFTAQELVALLSACGKILNISNAIMGLTVLAWGNSIGDMVSNVVVARKGFPQMAISACYAAPLSNMLLGLGISLTLKLAKLRATSFSLAGHLSNTVFWGFIFLISVLILTGIVVPLSKFSFLKKLAILLLVIYGVFTLISLLTEFNLIFKGRIIWDAWPGRAPA